VTLLFGPRELKRRDIVLTPPPRIDDLCFRRNRFAEITFDLSRGIEIPDPGVISDWDIGSVGTSRRGDRGDVEFVWIDQRSCAKRRENRSCGSLHLPGDGVIGYSRAHLLQLDAPE